MLTREERKERNIKFWDSFKKEMRSVKSSSGRSISWISYPSDVKNVYIRMEIDGKGARLCIDMQPKDSGIREILWEQMTELKVVMEGIVGEASWIENHSGNGGLQVSRICWENNELNFFDQNDEEKIKTYLKEKLIAFDIFYQEYKDILIALAE